MQQPNKLVNSVSLDNDNKVITIVSSNLKNAYIPPKDSEGNRCIPISIAETLVLSHFHKKKIIFFDELTRVITNDQGEIMFGMMNGNQATYASGDECKVYVETIDKSKAQEFLSTLKAFKLQEKVVIQLQEKVQEEFNLMHENLGAHVNVLTKLHEELCKILAISGYNEFKNKIHIDPDGKVFMIDKSVDVKIEDL